ncbi:AVID protein, partial [Columbina picui]|nr:AVID protein [Columbina picui]
GTGTAPDVQCDLEGLWRSKLGSNMTVSTLDANGTFSGSYHTAVAIVNKQILLSPLQDAQQHPSDKGEPTFGFTMHWHQCFVDHRGKETLETTWLLQEEVPSCKDTWKAIR